MPTETLERAPSSATIQFLWLELTNRCNLRCVHCYAESGPDGHHSDRLDVAEYRRLLDEARELGCQHVQFIGGEPTINQDLPQLIAHASRLGYTLIEVFTNLNYLPDDLLRCFAEFGVSVATSFYSAEPELHDAITQVRGSHERTVRNMIRTIAAGRPLRVGIIEMPENDGGTETTIAYLRSLGVHQVSVDRLRKFGRADSDQSSPSLAELCGSCAGDTLCVSPDGAVSACIMSKHWSVGSVCSESLASLANSEGLSTLRGLIRNEVDGAHGAHVCEPCIPQCSPGQQCNPCNPNGGQPCSPNGRCGPN